MSMLEILKSDQLTARKSRDSIATNLLTTLIAEASKVSEEDYKKGLTEITDAKVITTLKKFLKNAEETRGHLLSASIPSGPGQWFRYKLEETETEISILNKYIPQQLDELQLQVIIQNFRAENPGANVGAVMSHLKNNYSGLYDGKIASQLAK